MIIDLLTQDYRSKSIDNNQSELINMYLEEDTNKGKYKLVAYPTFGLVSFCDTTQANVRALYEFLDVLYCVAGNKFYSINSAGTKTELGTLNTSSGFAKIAAISGGGTSNQLVIIDGTNGYHYNVTTATATFPIVDVDFPQTADDITNQDDYIIIKKASSIAFAISNLADGLSYDALDFGSKIRFPDRLAAICSRNAELWLLGTRTTQPFFNSGNADFPFEQIPSTLIEYGCAAKRSVVVSENTLYCLAKNANGGNIIVKYNGYAPQKISTRAIDYQISQLTSVSDCIAYAYSLEGHEFIDFTFPTDLATMTYDTTTGGWLQRKSYNGSAYSRFLGSCHASCYNKSLIGAYNSGVIYQQSSTTYTENGTAIQRRFVSPILYSEGKRIFIDGLRIDVENNIGSSKTFDLEKSHDNGRTWTTVGTYTIPTSGAGRINIQKLGSERSWMFRITSTTNGKFVLLGFQATGEIGAN